MNEYKLDSIAESVLVESFSDREELDKSIVDDVRAYHWI